MTLAGIVETALSLVSGVPICVGVASSKRVPLGGFIGVTLTGLSVCAMAILSQVFFPAKNSSIHNLITFNPQTLYYDVILYASGFGLFAGILVGWLVSLVKKYR